MAPQFEGKVAVVTGGNSGIGRATAIRFAQEGAKVVVAARRIQQGEETVEEIRGAGGVAIFVRTDVSKAAEVESMVSQAVEAYGRLDFALNSAGAATGGPMHETTEEDWERVIDVNLKRGLAVHEVRDRPDARAERRRHRECFLCSWSRRGG